MIYNNTDILTTSRGVKYYKALKYPPIPPSESDVYVVTVQGDRLDLLSYQYYKDPTLWWVISVANSNITFGSMFPEPGTQLRIPTNISNVIELFNAENQQ
jgi:nucleoid-associated protein YgaU